jgi:hypothetical protein
MIKAVKQRNVNTDLQNQNDDAGTGPKSSGLLKHNINMSGKNLLHVLRIDEPAVHVHNEIVVGWEALFDVCFLQQIIHK